jgi:CheY-like chemotaxis protein
VQIISIEEERQHGLSHGAFSYMVKPATTQGLEECFDRIKGFVAPRTKRLLVVEDNETERQSIVQLLGHDDIEIMSAGTGGEAFQALLDRPFDCCVLDLRLPDMSGFELLEKLQTERTLRDLPIVVFTGKALLPEEEKQLQTMAKSIVLKDVQSPERLLDETALFLHRVVAHLPEAKQKMIARLHDSNDVRPAVPLPANPGAYRQSDEGGPGEVPRSRRFGLHRQTGGYRSTALAAASVVVSVSKMGLCPRAWPCPPEPD